MSRIYRMGDAGLTALTAEDFEKEQELEALIARYPELLGDEDRRHALVRRQQGIGEVDEAPDRWAVDLLLVDHEAVPTLVEVKRGSNSDLRRRVVGQMLDYAAHARHVSVDGLRESFDKSARSAGRDPDSVLSELLDDGDGARADEFWERVSTNLRASRLRLLFAADAIPEDPRSSRSVSQRADAQHRRACGRDQAIPRGRESNTGANDHRQVCRQSR